MGRYRYKIKKGDGNMDLKDFIIQNKEKIRKLSEQNTKRNSKGEVVITKSDPWRNEVTPGYAGGNYSNKIF